MRYNYFVKKGKDEFRLVSLQELKNELNKVCLKTIYINEWISAEETDLKKVEKVLRAIRKGTHYNILSNDYLLCCYAKKVKEND